MGRIISFQYLKRVVMQDEWYYARDGRQSGPVSDQELRRLVNDRTLRPEDLVWREGMADWEPAGSVKGLFETQESVQSSDRAGRTADEKYCHGCGAAIRQKAELCPQCGARQPSMFGQEVQLEFEEREFRGRLATLVLISAIANIVVGWFWITSICGIPLGIGMLVLCIFEFLYYANAGGMSSDRLVQNAGRLAVFEIVFGVFNWISLVCGILLMIHKGKYRAENRQAGSPPHVRSDSYGF
jgi:hypothetical protein